MEPVSKARIRVELLNRITEISGERGGPLGLRLGRLTFDENRSASGCSWDFRELKVSAEYRSIVMSAMECVRTRFPKVKCPPSPVRARAIRRTVRRVRAPGDRSISSS